MENYIGVIIAIAGIVIALIVKSIIDMRNDRVKLILRLQDEWGIYPDIEYTPGKLESIKKYYLEYMKSTDVDDITWNDLDMDEMFVMLNNTQSSMGEEVLYSMLRSPLYDKDELSYRDRLISYFFENETDRLLLQKYLFKIGKNKKVSFYEYFNRLNNIPKENGIYHFIIDAVWLASVGLLFFEPVMALGLIFINLFAAISTYYRRKMMIDAYYSIFSFLLKMLYSSEKLASLDIDIINDELKELKEDIRNLSGLKRNSYIVLSPNGGNLIDIVLDYIKMITHIDLIKFNKMIKIIEKNRDTILNIHGIVGTLDVYVAIASYRKLKEETGVCTPVFDAPAGKLTVKDVYHPFIEEPVYNSFDSDKCALITGSNASGKSTFLKSVAINIILAQTIATVNASEYKSACSRIMTSMALTDNIFDNKSYFIVEIMSLKRIVDTGHDIPVICCIDEVLRGTNTIERIAASGQILKHLAKSGVLCFAATHDMELAGILEDYYDNYHFSEKIIEDNIMFDYKLYDGVSTSRNAINLLQILGYDEPIVTAARQSADEFEKNGVWSRL